MAYCVKVQNYPAISLIKGDPTGRDKLSLHLLHTLVIWPYSSVSKIVELNIFQNHVQSRPKAFVYSLFLGVKWHFSRGRDTR